MTEKMYSYKHGIVDCHSGNGVVYFFAGGVSHSFCADGKEWSLDKYPTFISLEQAEKQGLVRKVSQETNRLRVKYRYVYDDDKKCFISDSYYETAASFEINRLDARVVSFVDDDCNECDPPEQTVEWEEIKPGKNVSVEEEA